MTVSVVTELSFTKEAKGFVSGVEPHVTYKLDDLDKLYREVKESELNLTSRGFRDVDGPETVHNVQRATCNTQNIQGRRTEHLVQTLGSC